ncbi:paraquat-inducible protein A [Robbsia andropogonis]|uniref:paraquat-inducible protein A n=1 Tax=Robbsia andropogonis TaxID=28092 RepID=UPI0004651A94|nr:paraquat-inducible protein A [Robbsia andropogonis]
MTLHGTPPSPETSNASDTPDARSPLQDPRAVMPLMEYDDVPLPEIDAPAGERRHRNHRVSARTRDLVGCIDCGLVTPRVRTIDVQYCLRCGSPLLSRKPDATARVWALLVSAVLLYIPANLMPVMHTASLLGASDDTIMSGVVYFWTSGSYALAIIVFVASILVPMLKLAALSILNYSVQTRSDWRPEQRTRLYHVVEAIGRWSMLDIFVITLTVALVRFQSLAVITAGPGAVAFGAVVVLTMFASLQFDSRRIWDPIDESGTARK